MLQRTNIQHMINCRGVEGGGGEDGVEGEWRHYNALEYAHLRQTPTA